MVQQRKPETPGQEEGRSAVHEEGSLGSLLDRVSTSTFALLQEAVSHPRPENLAASLVSSSARSIKGDSSSGPSNMSGPSSQRLQEQCPSHSCTTTPRYEDSFRSQHQGLPDHPESLNDEFNTFNTTSDRFPEGPLVYNSRLDALTPYKGKRKTLEDGVSDGAVVVGLLSDPDFSVDELPDSLFEREQVEEHTNIWDINEQTRERVARLRAEMPPAPVHQVPSSDNPLQLLPNFNNQNQISSKEVAIALAKVRTTELPPRTVPSATQPDLEPWLDVVTKYQDEVWGDLLPLVEEARKEVRAAMEEGNTALKGCPAVRRLRMILGHIDPLKSP